VHKKIDERQTLRLQGKLHAPLLAIILSGKEVKNRFLVTVGLAQGIYLMNYSSGAVGDLIVKAFLCFCN